MNPKTNPTDTGMNRTGIATSPIDSGKLVKAAEDANTGGEIDGKALEAERVVWARESPPVGTVPPPGTLKGVAKAVLEKLQGHKPTVFIDKLGERLAYERTGTRLYDALLAKHAVAHVHSGGPTRAEIMRIRDAEHRHMLVIRDAMQQLGADPTAVTPCADVIAVASLGWIQVLGDPRTTLTQCLDVMLSAEVTDTASWELLCELADGLGFDDLAEQFRACLVEEEEHVVTVRTWIANALSGQAGVAPTPPRPQPAAPR